MEARYRLQLYTHARGWHTVAVFYTYEEAKKSKEESELMTGATYRIQRKEEDGSWV